MGYLTAPQGINKRYLAKPSTGYLDREKKPESDKFEMGLSAWMDRLLRGQYASAASAKEFIRAGTEGRKPYIKEAIKRGLTGKEKASYQQVMRMSGYGGKTATGLGFAADVLLDPTTYLTLGTSKLATKAGQKALALKVAGRPILKSV